MGEINLKPVADRTATTKRKEHSTRVDLTPMVDLGFLLITFFIFTSSMSEPTMMKLVLPSDKHTDRPNKSPAEKTLNLEILGGNKISFYHGTDSTKATIIEQTGVALRKIIIEKKKALLKKFGTADDLMIIIKPADAANYGSIVDVLDEMKINGIRKFVLLN